jgi:hypothetical protein
MDNPVQPVGSHERWPSIAATTALNARYAAANVLAGAGTRFNQAW